MEDSSTIVKKIIKSTPKELGVLLDSINRIAYQENEWNSISVRASYAYLINAIEVHAQQTQLQLDFNNLTCEFHDCLTNETFIYDVYQALTNLKLAYSYFQNPPVVENPNAEEIKVNVDTIDWNKPVYTIEEVRKLLDVSENVLRKWIQGGWISYTQMNGSDKRFIEKDNLLEFLHNPKIFYPKSK